MTIKHLNDMRGSRGGDRGTGPPPLAKSQKYILSNNAPGLLENHKATKLAFLSGYHRPASETPSKWRFAGGPMMVRFKCYVDPLSRKTLSELDPL